MLEVVTKKSFIESSSLLPTGGAKAPQGIASNAVSRIAQAENGTESKGCCNSIISAVKNFFNWILDLLCCRCFRKADDGSAKEDKSTIGFMRRDPLAYLTQVKGNILVDQNQPNDLNIHTQGMTLLMCLCDSEDKKEENPFILQKGDSLFELIKACLDGGAKIEGRETVFGRSLFHHVHSVKVAELIAKKYENNQDTLRSLINESSNAGVSPLELAVSRGNHEMVEWFLKQGVAVTNGAGSARAFDYIQDLRMAKIFDANGRGNLLGAKCLRRGETLIHRTLQSILSNMGNGEELLALATYLIQEKTVGLDDEFNGSTARQLIEQDDRLARFRKQS